MKRVFILLALIAGMALYWALAQPAPPALGTLFPPGALVYLEAKNFSALLADWDSSPEKAAWLKTANYDQFSRSHLFLRLSDAQTEFAGAAGIPPDYALVSAVAGGNSALAIYNIGDLEFLYATHLASARVLDTALWKARGNYQTHHAGGADYYVKEDAGTHRVAAFAYAGDLLLIATKEALLAGALQLRAQPAASLLSEPWFAQTTSAAPPGANDLRLVYNMDRLRATPQFRSYWVQRNATALGQFSAGLADLERTPGEIRERRVLIRATSDATPDESATGPLLAAIPDDAGLYRAWLHPDADQARQLIEEKVFAATAPPKPANEDAPPVAATPEAGAEQDLETRIDETPLTDDRVTLAFRALQAQLSATKLDAILQVEKTRAADVFVHVDSAIAILASTPWNAAATRAAIAQAAGSLWSVAGIGALDPLSKIALAIDGRWLVVGNSSDLVNEIMSRRNRPAAAGATYAARYRHARELANFERMTKLIDFPQIAPAPDPAAPREPLFYSENLASLGRVLARVRAAEIAVHDNGAMLHENVVYRIAP